MLNIDMWPATSEVLAAGDAFLRHILPIIKFSST